MHKALAQPEEATAGSPTVESGYPDPMPRPLKLLLVLLPFLLASTAAQRRRKDARHER
ncbi:hypothetical protein SAMN00790413_00686 [Deinococcus hopiensis KR-140]|uniref:Uncharacterized protein n=1 Tax=Deinococcus hopiensis KR-140 TaxID=695939 RepID=A0A1W1VAI7_9DEIO|nr:hypothetical protein SAMN00790413_00686 [Deinococcus hopiensis KR-140]